MTIFVAILGACTQLLCSLYPRHIFHSHCYSLHAFSLHLVSFYQSVSHQFLLLGLFLSPCRLLPVPILYFLAALFSVCD